MNMEGKEIAYTALKNLDPLLLKGEWQPFKTVNDDVDGQLTLIADQQNIRFDAIVKKEPRMYQVENIIHHAHRHRNLIVIAYRLFPALKQKLKEHGVNYLEANGNLYIRAKNVILFIDRELKLDKPEKTGNRAFTPTGLKVVFGFLQHNELINKPQREIARTTGVALGNIPKIMAGLQDAGHVYKVDKKTYAFHNREELLQIWIDEYKKNLQPTLYKGTFRLVPADREWRNLELHVPDTVWGGEPAGDLLTNYLRPEKLTIYTNETKMNLMMHYGLVPDLNGNIQVYKKFWEQNDQRDIAPELLVYADLVNTQDKRCIETANRIYNERIKPEL